MKNIMNRMIAIVGTAALTAACTGNFEEINNHPYNPDITDVTPLEAVGALFPKMTELLHCTQENDSQMIEQMVFNNYGGYMVPTNRFQGNNFGTYNAPAGWIQYPFQTFFEKFQGNYSQVKAVTGANGYIYAWANIVRVGVMLKMVDMYGPIPYTKIDPAREYTEYDSVQDVYHAMIEELSASAATLTQFVAELGGRKPEIGAFDIVYGGDFAKWIKLANSLKLRMAVRIALVDTDYAKKAMAEAIAGGCIVSNADNASIATLDNGYAKASKDWGDLGINATLTTYLKGLNDPRTAVYVTNTHGIRPGIDYDDLGKNLYGYFGGRYAMPNIKSTDPALVFCAAETRFLMAEAAVRGWVPGDAGALYNEGIELSMAHRGVPMGNYLSEEITVGEGIFTDEFTPDNNLTGSIFATPLAVAWNEGASNEVKIEQIVTQKWLANFTLGAEGWADFRRTGYPRMLPAKNNLDEAVVKNPTAAAEMTSVRLARRLPYPDTENRYNGTNVASAVSNLLGGADNYGTELWWAKDKQ